MYFQGETDSVYVDGVNLGFVGFVDGAYEGFYASADGELDWFARPLWQDRGNGPEPKDERVIGPFPTSAKARDFLLRIYTDSLGDDQDDRIGTSGRDQRDE